MTQNSIISKLKENPVQMFILLSIIEIIALILSIFIPYNIILYIHRAYGCRHHSGGIDGNLWEWGRALGFASLIWFVISSFQGITMNFHAKLLGKKKKARDLHCFSSFLCILFMIIHFSLLLNSEPWRSIILLTDSEHFGLRVFRAKIISGIIFGVVMSMVSILSIFARSPKIMKKIGYKRFKYIHWFMMVLTVVLIFHIIYINTEIWIIVGEKIR
ncbi:MAG: ferric reductase-like transmembrane domain-containing protein [Candidatus Hermodarchaeota archaeon]